MKKLEKFDDEIKGEDDDVKEGIVNIRIKKRNGRKNLNNVKGM
jgi:translation initiation factor 1 (eIF-1/SUI1)